jgi:UTP--glucose-1-phosphate uridylyltransferase
MADEKKAVRKAVIAAAGFGTRFLPQTKAMPKEMLPIVDKPVIQYVVEELVSAGIEDIVIVTGYHKRSVEDHFDHMSADLRESLKKSGKIELLQEIKKISSLANFIYIRQKGPQGNATPVRNAEHLIGDEPFIYTWGDEFIKSNPPQFKIMVDAYQEFGCPVVLTMPVKQDEDYDRYGFYAGSPLRPGVIKVDKVVEKPGKDHAPSQTYSAGGFLLTANIFPYVEKLFTEHSGGEAVIQRAYQQFVDDGNDMVAVEITDGQYYDTGNKLDYLKTVVDFALTHDELKDDFLEFLRAKIT